MVAMSDLSALNLEEGSLVGGYTLIARLGSGAMGSVVVSLSGFGVGVGFLLCS